MLSMEKGPYTIMASLGKGLYCLKELNGEKVFIYALIYYVMTLYMYHKFYQE